MGHESQPAHKLTKLPDGRILATNESEDCYFVLSPDGTRERVDIRTAAVLYNQARSQESKRPKGRSRGRGTAAADPDDGRRGQREGWPGTRGSQDPGAPGFAGDPGSLGDSGEFGDSGSPGVLGDPRRGGAFFSKEKEKGETLGAFVMMELRKEYEAMKERRRILGRERRARLKAEKERAKREAASPGSTEQEDSRPRLAKQSVKERAAILMARVAELEAQLEASRKAEEGKENKE
ncbi:MAG: hypothetical protein RBU30_08705 [Polyangia bacterium]|jgi:hypothetical protein|nr:hypothetical protein [Polyangia bacterium]